MNRESLAVLATVGEDGQPEAALMGFAVTPQLELIFDTVKSSRKYPNPKKNPRVAWVIGCSAEVTVQYERSAEELESSALAKHKIPTSPNSGWAGARKLARHHRLVVRPKWVRYCDYNPPTRKIEEMKFT